MCPHFQEAHFYIGVLRNLCEKCFNSVIIRMFFPLTRDRDELRVMWLPRATIHKFNVHCAYELWAFGAILFVILHSVKTFEGQRLLGACSRLLGLYLYWGSFLSLMPVGQMMLRSRNGSPWEQQGYTNFRQHHQPVCGLALQRCQTVWVESTFFPLLQHCLHMSGCAAFSCCLWLDCFSLWMTMKCLRHEVLTENIKKYLLPASGPFPPPPCLQRQRHSEGLSTTLSRLNSRNCERNGSEMASSDRDASWAVKSERKVGSPMTQRRDWTPAEIGRSAGRWSETAAVEIGGSERQMRYRHRNRHEMRKESGRNCHGRWWSEERLEGESFEDNAVKKDGCQK